MPLLIDELEMRGVIAGNEGRSGGGAEDDPQRDDQGHGRRLRWNASWPPPAMASSTRVAASLKNNYPTLDWNKVIEYNIERMASHGVRRADEMDQVVDTLRELGVEPLMAAATSKRQREMGLIGKEPAVRSTLHDGRAAMLKAISAAAKDKH